MKDREPREFFVCEEHGEVVYGVIKNGVSLGLACEKGCEIESLLDTRTAMGWMFTWEELGLEESPFPDDPRM